MMAGTRAPTEVLDERSRHGEPEAVARELQSLVWETGNPWQAGRGRGERGRRENDGKRTRRREGDGKCGRR